MSSVIPKQPKREREQITIKLDKDLLRKLEQYGRYLESSRDYIISAALELIFRRDKSFADWLQKQSEIDTTPPLEPRTKQQRRSMRSITTPSADTAA